MITGMGQPSIILSSMAAVYAMVSVPWVMIIPSKPPRIALSAAMPMFLISSQDISVLSMFISCSVHMFSEARPSTSSIFFICSSDDAGTSPFSVSTDDMVPPVASHFIFFIFAAPLYLSFPILTQIFSHINIDTAKII